MRTIADIWLGTTLLSMAAMTVYIADIEFWAWRERKREAKEKQAAGYARLLDDLMVGNEPDPTIQVYVFQTPYGSKWAWHVPGATDADIAQNMIDSRLFKRVTP